MSRARSAILGVAWRNVYTTMKTPSLAVPPLMVPLFTLAVVAGGLSAVSRVPRFNFHGNYTAFAFIFILVQSAAMCGHFSALALARDFETRFSRRLMVSVPKRWYIVAGFALAALARAIVTVPILFLVGWVFGMDTHGSVLQLLELTGLSLLISLVAGFWSMGVALRLRTTQAAPAMMMPIFATLFAAPAFLPLAAMTGWLHKVASVDPVTPFIEAGRGLISGQPKDVALALGVAVGMILLLGVWTGTGLKRAQAAGG